jgi:hypothetical protein
MHGFAFESALGDGMLQAFDPENASLLLGDDRDMAADMETRYGHQLGAAQGCAASHSELFEPTRIMMGEGEEEDGSSASRCVGEDGLFSLEWGSEEAGNGLVETMKEDILGSLDFADDEIKVRHDGNAEHFADDRYAGSSGTSSGSSPRSEEGGGTQMEGVSKEDKKRRNRVAARVCRCVFSTSVLEREIMPIASRAGTQSVHFQGAPGLQMHAKKVSMSTSHM